MEVVGFAAWRALFVLTAESDCRSLSVDRVEPAWAVTVGCFRGETRLLVKAEVDCHKRQEKLLAGGLQLVAQQL